MKKTLLITLAFTFWTALGTAQETNVPMKAEDVSPLLISEEVPDKQLKDIEGNTVSLKQLVKGENTIIVFYRGGWCPYCNRQLSGLGAISSDLIAKGYQILAISPDRPEELQKSMEKHDLNYTLLSDATMEVARAFGISFKVSDGTVKKYKTFGINLEEASGEAHHELPVPSVFFVNAKGEIGFEYVSPNYKQRISPELLKAAAEQVFN
ncbi:peroxiredoxin-like family protein [Algivirga pacifica]|uniref:thioredoxin-dependent peroxiredoxin n=1 Tax=Algivirga pacifica TaxID=1162670 RepID=A0ABP9CZF6_9BACT